jgi:EpsI family protein
MAAGSDRVVSTLLISLLLGVGALAWWLELRAPLVVDAAALASLPSEIEGWRARDVPLESTVERELRADFNLQRVYASPSGEAIWLYVGYYGTARGGRPAHTPRGCYTGAGFGIESARRVDVDPASGLRLNEYIVERGGERQLVHFWYRSHRRTGLLGGLDQNIDRLIGRLWQGRADGALVRLSTALRGGDESVARARLVSFAMRLDPLLAERWPIERPAGTV